MNPAGKIMDTPSCFDRLNELQLSLYTLYSVRRSIGKDHSFVQAPAVRRWTGRD
jgi:hypothetical protein